MIDDRITSTPDKEEFFDSMDNRCSYHTYKDLNVYCTKHQWEEMKAQVDEMVEEFGYDKEDALAELADNLGYGYNYGVKPARHI